MKSSRHRVSKNPHIQSLAALVKLTIKYSKEELRDWIAFRDRFLSTSELKCVYCGRTDLVKDQPEEDPIQLSNLATIDHVFPVSKGGKRYDLKNCVVACPKCNQKKADKII